MLAARVDDIEIPPMLVALLQGEKDEEEEEETVELLQHIKQADPLLGVRIKRVIDGARSYGYVEDIELGKTTGDKLYRIRYDDGDLEHLLAHQVSEFQVDGDAGRGQVLKRPAAA